MVIDGIGGRDIGDGVTVIESGFTGITLVVRKLTRFQRPAGRRRRRKLCVVDALLLNRDGRVGATAAQWGRRLALVRACCVGGVHRLPLDAPRNVSPLNPESSTRIEEAVEYRSLLQTRSRLFHGSAQSCPHDADRK